MSPTSSTFAPKGSDGSMSMSVQSANGATSIHSRFTSSASRDARAIAVFRCSAP
ncbi:MAG TPA: hypothetical protein VNA69_11265 [Thermoanaerobaculia bacterium]|nr:hypothetical protein [Thermoanaerobaculia bacterium]